MSPGPNPGHALNARRATAALFALVLLATLAGPPAPPDTEWVPAPAPVDTTADEARQLAAQVRADRSHRAAVNALSAVPPKTSAPVRKTVAAPAKSARQPRTAAHPAPVASANLATVIAFALAQQGKPYRFGATGPSSWDCSGLIMMAYRQIGIRLPRQSGDIATSGRTVPRSQLRPGDVLAWNGHVALALGGNRMVHASRAGQPVRVANIYGHPRVVRIVG